MGEMIQKFMSLMATSAAFVLQIKTLQNFAASTPTHKTGTPEMLNITRHSNHSQQDTKRATAWISRFCLQAILLASVSFSALAIQPIPEKTGVSGFINLGIIGMSVESNLLAETPLSDLGAERITNLNDSPDSESLVMPSINFELSYTWADSSTQLYIGNQLEDFLRFDLSTNVGIRKGAGNAGIFAIEVISSPIETKVWSDPYQTNIDRQNTPQTSEGARVIWDKVLGSKLEIRYSTREVELDDELSGTGLGLSATDRALLNREGDINRFDISYAFSVGNKQLLVPRLSFTEYDLDGKAMAHDDAHLELSYANRASAIQYVINMSYGTSDFEEINPVFGVEDETDRLGATATMFWKRVFGLKGWMGNASVIWFSQDHEIDFYDTSITAVSVGMLHRF